MLITGSCQWGMMVTRFLIVWSAVFAGGMVLGLSSARVAAEEIQPDYLMLRDPELDVVPVEKALPEGAVRLWSETLRRPQPELIKVAAECIAAAHAEGLPGLVECVPELRAVLATADLHPSAAYAVCRALIVLEAHEAADELYAVADREGTSFRLMIEPVLAEWDYQPIREEWRRRLGDESTHRRELILACTGTGRVKDELALPLLLEMVRTGTRSSDVRLAAARSAGTIATSGLEPDAARLMGEASALIDDLCAVSLIERHTSREAQALLLDFAVHKNPVVAASALRSLLEIDPSLVLPLAEEALQRDDPKVRQCGLDAYIALPTVERIPRIADVLDDPHPEVRGSACAALHRFSEQETFAEAVRGAGMDVLSRDGWRGQEQAALLLGAMDHEPAASRLVELLDSDRPEVMIAAAWGLRKLAVPEAKDGILDRAQRMTEHVLSTPPQQRQPGSDRQLGHLFEAMAVSGDARGIPVMRRHVRRDVHREKSRSAAIWGLGKLLEDQPDDELARELMERIADIDSVPPELALVRQMSAITIGRMHAASQLANLQTAIGRYVVNASPISLSLAWAIERLGGELPPPAERWAEIRGGWPLEPVSPRRDP